MVTVNSVRWIGMTFPGFFAPRARLRKILTTVSADSPVNFQRPSDLSTLSRRRAAINHPHVLHLEPQLMHIPTEPEPARSGFQSERGKRRACGRVQASIKNFATIAKV